MALYVECHEIDWGAALLFVPLVLLLTYSKFIRSFCKQLNEYAVHEHSMGDLIYIIIYFSFIYKRNTIWQNLWAAHMPLGCS